MEDKRDTTQERIPCCWQVFGWMAGKHCIKSLVPNPLPCSSNHPRCSGLCGPVGAEQTESEEWFQTRGNVLFTAGPQERGRRGRGMLVLEMEGGGGSTLPAVVCHTEPGDLLVLISNVSRTARPPLPRAILLLFLLLSA